MSRNTAGVGDSAPRTVRRAGLPATAAARARRCANRGAARYAACRTRSRLASGASVWTASTKRFQSGSVAGRHRLHCHRPCSSRAAGLRDCPQPAHCRRGWRQVAQRHVDPRMDGTSRAQSPQIGAATSATPLRRRANSNSPTTCGAGGAPSCNTSGRSVNALTIRRCSRRVVATDCTASRTAPIFARGSAAATSSTTVSKGSAGCPSAVFIGSLCR